MRFLINLIIVCIVLLCVEIGRKQPTLAGLIVVMPITSLIALILLYRDNPGKFDLMIDYTTAALWGILPSILFFIAALVCFRRQLPLWMVLCVSFGVWLIAAFIHQWLLSE